jgi:uncharacterized membrane protein
LVLNIDVPRLSGDASQVLSDKLLALWPDLFSYALGFAVIGRFWIVHHRVLGLLRAVDGRFMALNLLFLGFVALIPFTSELLARYGREPVAVMWYAAVIALASFTSWGMTNYAKRRGLVKPAAIESARPFGTVQALVIPGVFLTSIPVALFSTVLAEALWIATFVFHPARLTRRSRRLHGDTAA